MRMLIPKAILAVLAFVPGATPDGPKAKDLEDVLFPLPPPEVAAGMFEKWQKEAVDKKGPVSYTRVDYDKNTYWVAVAQSGYGDPPNKIAVYAPKKDGSFRRSLLAGPIQGGNLVAAVDTKTGLLELRDESTRTIKGELVLSCNLKHIGILP